MFSTGISYNEAESAIQKLDPSMRADYEKSLSDLRKAETVYAEEGRQAISYMDLALNLECHAGTRRHKVSPRSGTRKVSIPRP